MKALEKDRTRRYQTGNALAADVRHHLNNEPVMAGPPSTVYRAKTFVRRHRFGVGAAAVALTLLILGVAWTGIGWVRATRAERAATAEAAKGTVKDEDYTGIIGNLALLPFDRGDYAAAEPLSRDVRAADRASLRPGDPNLAVSLNTLARVARVLGRHDEALSLYVEAEGILAKHSHPWEAVALGNIGELECEIGKGTPALAHLREAVAVGNERLGEKHTDVRVVRKKSGNCLGRIGTSRHAGCVRRVT
jgi:tetratricopeptide (TPR) repeat protein